MPTSNYLTQTDVKERGWTDSLIRRFLPSPDLTKGNPFYRCAAPMKLYAVGRVSAIETTPEYIEHSAKLVGRRKAAQRAVETKRKKLLAYLDTIEIQVPILTNLVGRACKSYNARNGGGAYPHSDKSFLDRICVNYLRHEMTDYEAHLYAIAGKVGVAEGYREIKNRVLYAIADTYPELSDECFRQMCAA